MIDDEPLVLRGLEVMLKSWDVQVHAVRTLSQAKELFTEAAILLTGDTSPERLAEAERSGCRLLHKPVNADTLGAVLKAVCLK